MSGRRSSGEPSSSPDVPDPWYFNSVDPGTFSRLSAPHHADAGASNNRVLLGLLRFGRSRGILDNTRLEGTIRNSSHQLDRRRTPEVRPLTPPALVGLDVSSGAKARIEDDS